MKGEIKWYASTDEIIRMGPFASQVEAWEALRLAEGPRVHPAGATVWPERTVAPKKHKLRWSKACNGRAVCTQCGMKVRHKMNAGARGGTVIQYALKGEDWTREVPPCLPTWDV